MWWASHADGCEMADECSDCDQSEVDCRKVLKGQGLWLHYSFRSKLAQNSAYRQKI